MRAKPTAFVYLLLTAGLVFLLYALLRKESIDIHFKDTYYVLPPRTVYLPVSMFLFCNAALYYFASRHLRREMLSWLHVLLTIAGLTLIFGLPVGHSLINLPRRFMDPVSAAFSPVRIVVFSATVLIAAGFICLFINFILPVRGRKI